MVHAAGVLDDGLLSAQSADRARRVLAPKAAGAHHLHQATAGHPLRFFVLMSSAAAAIGHAGQSTYGAANAALDALARHRRHHGLPAVAIGLGPVAGPGMAEAVAAWPAGVTPMPAEDLGAILDGALAAGGPAQVLAAPFDWVALGPHLAAGARAALAATTDPDPVGDDALVAQLRALDPEARRARLADRIAESLADLFPHGIEPDQGFFDAGLDSVTALEARGRLQRLLQRPVSATVAFDHPTLGALADHALTLLDLGRMVAPIPQGGSTPGADDEPIAIVGLHCRLPGAEGADAAWRLFLEGGHGFRRIDRFDVDALHDPTPGQPGRVYVRDAALLDDLRGFDAPFFSIPAREAEALDPQQRLLLEVGWGALETAGIDPTGLHGEQVGVFVGISTSEYGRRFDQGEGHRYAGSGNTSSFAAGRIAHTLGLRGPAMSVDTACSSSLVALHMAAASLRSGESDLALAGGVNAIVGPETTIQLCQVQALSPTDRIRPFDAAADGYVRGEGCGVVVLQRLSDAIAQGRPVLAVLRATAINHDGRSAGLTVPNGAAQEALIRTTLDRAGLQGRDIDLLECHGTGTPWGIPSR